MSWLDGQDKISVGVLSTPLVDEIPNNLPAIIGDAVINKKPIVPTLIKRATNSINAKVNQYLLYGKHVYQYGLPVLSHNKYVLDEAALKQVIESIEGESITLLNSYLSAPLGSLLAKDYVAQFHGWNAHSGTFDNLPTSVTDQFTRQFYIGEISLSGGTYDKLTNKLTITYAQDYEEDDRDTATLVVDKPNYSDRIYQAVYKVDSDPIPSNPRYFFYDPAEGTQPTLNLSGDTFSGLEFLPIAPLRVGDQMISVANSSIANEVEDLLDNLNIRLEDMEEGIGGSPDIDAIEDAFFGFTVDLYSEEENDLAYLVNFFEHLSTLSTVTREEYEQWYADNLYQTDRSPNPRIKTAPPSTQVTINANYFNLLLLFNFIEISYVPGESKPIGHTTKSIKYPTYTHYATIDDDDSITEEKEKVYANDGEITFTVQEAGQVKVIKVHGLQHVTDVYKNRRMNTILSEDDESKGFFIPVAPELFPIKNAEVAKDFYYGAMHLVIYAEQTTHLEWYETEDFLFAVQVVLVVVSVISLNATFAELAGEFAISTTSGLLALAKIIATITITDIAVDWLINEIGAEASLYLAVVLAAVAALSGDGTKLFGDVTWADDLLRTSIAVAEGVGEYNMEELEELQEDMLEAADEYEEQMEVIAEAQKLLEADGIDPLTFITTKPIMHLDESPSQFYFRAIHNKNPGVMSLATPEYYVANQLELPRKVKNFNRG